MAESMSWESRDMVVLVRVRHHHGRYDALAAAHAESWLLIRASDTLLNWISKLDKLADLPIRPRCSVLDVRPSKLGRDYI